MKVTLTEHKNYVNSLAKLPNGDWVSGSNDMTIKIWDCYSEREKMTLKGHSYGIFSLAVLGNGDIASGSLKEIKIWNSTSGSLKVNITKQKNIVYGIGVLSILLSVLIVL